MSVQTNTSISKVMSSHDDKRVRARYRKLLRLVKEEAVAEGIIRNIAGLKNRKVPEGQYKSELKQLSKDCIYDHTLPRKIYNAVFMKEKDLYWTMRLLEHEAPRVVGKIAAENGCTK